MIYNNILNYSLVNTEVFNAAGCEILYLIESNYLTGFTITNNQINTLQTGANKFSVFDNLDELSYSVKTDNSKSGTVYVIEVNFKISGIRTIVNTVLEKLLNNNLTAILGDSNGRFWLLGYNQGFRSSFDYSSEDANYSVKLVTTQLLKPEEISFDLVNNLSVNDDYEDNTVIPVYVQTVPSQNGGTGGSGTGSGNVFNTITVSSDNYQLNNNDHFVIVTGAYTVFLPVSPENGQQHIIKAVYDASVSAVNITAAGVLIDSFNTVNINTNLGSLTLIYDSGEWHTTAFVV